MDAVLGALVAGAVGQVIQPLADRIARLEEAAVSNDHPATGSETAEGLQENSGNTGEDGNEVAAGSPPCRGQRARRSYWLSASAEPR